MTLHLSSSQIFTATFIGSHIIYLSSVFFYISKTMTPRSHVRHSFLFSLPFMLLPIIYTLLTGEITTASYKIILLLPPFLASMLLYRGSLFRHIENNLFVLLYASCIELNMGMVYYVISYALHLDLNTSSNTIAPENDPIRLFLFIFPPVIVQAIFTPFAIWLWNTYVQKMNLLILIKLGLVAFFIGTGVLYAFLEQLGSSGWIFVFLGLFLASVLFEQGLLEARQILKDFHLHRKKQKILEQNIADFKDIQEKNLLLRKQNHDIAGHLQVISILLQKGDLEKAEKYIQHFL